jgi:hypothetical protein
MPLFHLPLFRSLLSSLSLSFSFPVLPSLFYHSIVSLLSPYYIPFIPPSPSLLPFFSSLTAQPTRAPSIPTSQHAAPKPNTHQNPQNGQRSDTEEDKPRCYLDIYRPFRDQPNNPSDYIAVYPTPLLQAHEKGPIRSLIGLRCSCSCCKTVSY